MIKLVSVLTIIGFVGMAAGVAVATPPALYTPAQAKAGADVFAQNCAACHGAGLHGGVGPALTGQSFAGPASHATVGTIFSVIAEQMPADRPGGLSHTEYENVMAYILSQNGYMAGSSALDYQASLASPVPLVSQVK